MWGANLSLVREKGCEFPPDCGSLHRGWGSWWDCVSACPTDWMCFSPLIHLVGRSHLCSFGVSFTWNCPVGSSRFDVSGGRKCIRGPSTLLSWSKTFTVFVFFLEDFEVHHKTERYRDLPCVPWSTQPPHYQHPASDGTFVTTDEPILTRHNHTSPSFTLGFTLGVVLGCPKSSVRFFHKMLWRNQNELFGQLNTFCEFKQMSSEMYSSSWCHRVFSLL